MYICICTRQLPHLVAAAKNIAETRAFDSKMCHVNGQMKRRWSIYHHVHGGYNMRKLVLYTSYLRLQVSSLCLIAVLQFVFCLGSIALPCKLRSLMSCFRKLDCKMRCENLTEHGREPTASLAKTSHITVYSSSRCRHCRHSWDIAFTVGIQLTSAHCCHSWDIAFTVGIQLRLPTAATDATSPSPSAFNSRLPSAARWNS